MRSANDGQTTHSFKAVSTLSVLGLSDPTWKIASPSAANFIEHQFAENQLPAPRFNIMLQPVSPSIGANSPDSFVSPLIRSPIGVVICLKEQS
jgi:hypothetical protein